MQFTMAGATSSAKGFEALVAAFRWDSKVFGPHFHGPCSILTAPRTHEGR